MEERILYSIRTTDDRIVIFDEEVQKTDEGYSEIFFTIKDIAEELLKTMEPKGSFKIAETPRKEIVYRNGFTAEDIHQKALEEREIRRA